MTRSMKDFVLIDTCLSLTYFMMFSFTSHSFSFLSSGGDRADEQPVPAEAERTSDGCFQGGGAQPTVGIAQKWQNGQLP